MALNKDLTRGSVFKHVVQFAIPLLFSNLFQMLYNVIDMYFVGRYVSTAGQAAVTVSGPIMLMLVSAVLGMAMAVTVLIGQHQGRGDTEGIKSIASTANGFFLIVSLVITVLGLLICRPLLMLMNTPPEVLPMAIQFLSIIFTGTIFMTGYNLIGAYQRGLGDSKSAMYFIIVSVVANIVLDYLFIRWFKMGVAGAAWATVIAQGVAFVMGVIYFRRNDHIIRFNKKSFAINKFYLKQIVKIGLPSSLQQTLLAVSFSVFNGLINGYGAAASAAYGIGSRIDSFAILPAQALGLSVSSVAAQNLGVKNYDRAKKATINGMFLAGVTSLVMTVLIYVFAKSIVMFFNTDPAVVATGTMYLHTIPIMYIPFGVMWTAGGVVLASGKTMYTLFVSLFSQYIVRIPAAIIFSEVLGFGIHGIYYAMILGPFVGLIANVAFLISGKWKNSKILVASKLMGEYEELEKV